MTREEAIRILDPETAEEALAEIAYYAGFRGEETVAKAVNDACILAVAALREQEERRWIPVTERLPEEKVNCIVHYKHAYCDNDDYWAIGICFYDGEKFQIDWAYKVTHWMPLPEPPKEETT